MTTPIANRVVLITGASRGIGRQIALTAAEQGAAVVIATKSDTAHPKLPGTIHSVADEVRQQGGQALAVRDDASITNALRAVELELGADYHARSRSPQIMADAACRILATPPAALTGQSLIDETYLRSCGTTDLDAYRHDPTGGELAPDLFVDA